METSNRHERMYRLFVDASNLAPEERAPFLNKACGQEPELRHEVETLLARDARPSAFLNTPLVESERLFETLGSPTQGEMPSVPDRIGEYTIHNILGDGGMGIVYLASKESPPRRVALKVIRPGAASKFSLRRFEHEAAVLARLQHPGIAQIFETGTAETDSGRRPFFAMEFVDGLPITDYSRSSNLSVKDRLELMVKVCDAVEHAHQKSVIHRDLKPGNIFVDASGQPKILDFGIARLTDSDIQTTTLRTLAGHVIGTLAYMSPEQATGDLDAVDTRCDVYSLGVVLYELLAGRRPFDLGSLSIPEALRVIQKDEPAPLGSIDRRLRGDVETIVLKSLDKNRERRYQSASELAADVKRYLRDRPILARRPTVMYQLSRFTKRNKALVSGMAGILAALLLGFVATSWQAIRATGERDRALKAERQSAAFSHLWVDVLGEADAWRVGSEPTIEKLLDQVAAKIDILGADPQAEASLRRAVGNAYRAFGDTFPVLPQLRKAEPQLKAALDIRRRVLGRNHRDTLESAREYADLIVTLAHLEDAYTEQTRDLKLCRQQQAEDLLRGALDTGRRMLGDDDRLTLSILGDLASVLRSRGKSAEAEHLQREVLESLSRVLGAEHEETLAAQCRLADMLFTSGKLRESESLYRRALASKQRAHGEEHASTHHTMLRLAEVFLQRDKVDEALAMYRDGLEISRRKLGEESPRTLMLMNNFAMLLWMRAGELDEAESLLRRTLEIRRRVLPPNHGNTLRSRYNLASLIQVRGNLQEAEPMFRELVEIAHDALAPRHADIGLFESGFGDVLCDLKRYEDAERHLLGAHELLLDELGDEHRLTRRTVERLVKLYDAWDKPIEAAEWRQELPREKAAAPEGPNDTPPKGTKSRTE